MRDIRLPRILAFVDAEAITLTNFGIWMRFWKKKNKLFFEMLINTFSHESLHPVIESLEGEGASIKLDYLCDYYNGDYEDPEDITGLPSILIAILENEEPKDFGQRNCGATKRTRP